MKISKITTYLLISMGALNASAFSFNNNPNYNVLLESQRVQRADQVAGEIKTLYEYANLYILKTGDTKVTLDKIVSYFKLNKNNFKNYFKNGYLKVSYSLDSGINISGILSKNPVNTDNVNNVYISESVKNALIRKLQGTGNLNLSENKGRFSITIPESRDLKVYNVLKRIYSTYPDCRKAKFTTEANPSLHTAVCKLNRDGTADVYHYYKGKMKFVKRLYMYQNPTVSKFLVSSFANIAKNETADGKQITNLKPGTIALVYDETKPKNERVLIPVVFTGKNWTIVDFKTALTSKTNLLINITDKSNSLPETVVNDSQNDKNNKDTDNESITDKNNFEDAESHSATEDGNTADINENDTHAQDDTQKETADTIDTTPERIGNYTYYYTTELNLEKNLTEAKKVIQGKVRFGSNYAVNSYTSGGDQENRNPGMEIPLKGLKSNQYIRLKLKLHCYGDYYKDYFAIYDKDGKLLKSFYTKGSGAKDGVETPREKVFYMYLPVLDSIQRIHISEAWSNQVFLYDIKIVNNLPEDKNTDGLQNVFAPGVTPAAKNSAPVSNDSSTDVNKNDNTNINDTSADNQTADSSSGNGGNNEIVQAVGTKPDVLVDFDKNIPDGITYAKATLTTAGAFDGKSLNIASGGQYAKFPVSSSLLSSNQYTVSMWINSKDVKKLRFFLIKSSNISTSGTRKADIEYYFGNAGSNPGITAVHNRNESGFSYAYVRGTNVTNNLKTNTWQMITFTYSKPTLKVYINNVLVYTGSISNRPNSQQTYIYLGFPQSSMGFYGKIDNLMIWSGKTLNAQQIDKLYNTLKK